MSAFRGTAFTYANPSSIDPNLICAICTDPFFEPVFGAKCGHTFCRVCLEEWVVVDKSCPTCRKEIISLTPITVAGGRPLIDQLNRLSVGCSDCGKSGIQRGDFDDHRKKCADRIVHCSAATIQCDWQGRPTELHAHESRCNLVRVKPTIDNLQTQVHFLYRAVKLLAQKNDEECREEYVSGEFVCDACDSLVPLRSRALHICPQLDLCSTCFPMES